MRCLTQAPPGVSQVILKEGPSFNGGAGIFHQLPWVEDEWHLLLVCPLYDGLRHALPFTAAQLFVVGHPLQGDGCVPRNLTALVGQILALERIDVVVDFMILALKRRRESRRQSLSFQ